MRFEKFGEVKLDKKDKLLLAELDFDARQSLASLAKKLGMSKRGVEYKIRRLEKEEVILGYYPVINMPTLGYYYCRLLFSLQNTSPAIEKELLDYLVANPQFFWVFRMQGAADIAVVMWAKSMREFEGAMQDLTEKFGPVIHNKRETIAYDVIHYSHRYLLGESEGKEIHIAETDERVAIDDLDIAILKQLTNSARMPAVEIADNTKSTPRVVSYRIKRMEKNGLIAAYRVNIDHKKLGFVWHKLWIESSHSHEALVNFVKHDPAVVYVVEGVGLNAELDVEIVVKGSLDIYEFVNRLRAAFPGKIGGYESLMLADVKKVRYLPF